MNGEDRVESLFENVPPRPEPPADVRDRVLAAVEREWRRRRRRRLLPAAAAAVLLAAVTAMLVLGPPWVGVPVHVADTGGLRVNDVRHPEGGVSLRITRGTVLEAETPTRLTTDNATELRLREGTRITWLADQAVSLHRGTVYVRTRGHGRLQVHTPLGVVSDIGTTFMVTVGGDGLEVALREGAAAIDTGSDSYTARAEGFEGEVVTVAEGRIVARPEAASAGRWQWIHDLHPGYERRELMPLLKDIARDLGVALEFASPAVQAAALQSRLEGDLTGLGPEEALEVVLAASGFGRRASDRDILVIEFQSRDD